MNKKARLGEQGFLVYVIFIFLLIVGGIIIGSVLHTGKPYDMRMQDAEILLGKVIGCLSEKKDLTQAQIQDVLSLCKINKQVTQEGLTLIISSKEIEYFKQGDAVACLLQEKNIDYPRCKLASVNLNIDGKDTEISVIAGSNLKSGRISNE